MHHYTECGLSYVYLKNGYEVIEEDGEKHFSVHDLHNLHKTIGKHIINQGQPITGEQARYVRIELNYSQKQLGELLGVDTQTVARWEKEQTQGISRAVDATLRSLYAEFIDEDSKIGIILKVLAEANEKADMQRLELEENDHQWKRVA